MEQVRAAVIGFGGMGSKYAKMLYNGEIEGMSLAGVCCRNAQGQATLAKEYGGVQIYQDVEDALAHGEEFDAAIIVTPHTSHVGIGKKMVAAGKHILMDKPAGVWTREVRELIESAQAQGVSFGMIFNMRMAPVFQKAKELLAQDVLGRISRVVWLCNTWYRTPAYHYSAPWRSSWMGECGGLLINQSQHYLDLLQWLVGMPDGLLATLEYGKYNHFNVDDSADIQFFYNSGLHGTFISSTGENPGVNRLELWGPKGRMTIEDNCRLYLDENVMSTEDFAVENKEIYGVLEHHIREIHVEKAEKAYQKVLENFGEHLRTGAPLMADGREGLKSVTITNGAYLSSWLDKRLSLPVDEELFLEKLLEKRGRKMW